MAFNYVDVLEELKRKLNRLLDVILKYLPTKDTLALKEEIEKLNDTNTDLEKRLSDMAKDLVGNDFETKAKSVAAHFSDVTNRITKGSIEGYEDLLDYCDMEKMMKDFIEKNNLKPHFLASEKGLIKANEQQTIAKFLKEQKPGIDFDEKDIKAICNELACRGLSPMIDYFDKTQYIKDCFDGKISLPVDMAKDGKTYFIEPENDRTLVANLEKTIAQGKEYILDAIGDPNGDLNQAQEDAYLNVGEALEKIYIDRNIYIHDMVMDNDDFHMYGDLTLTGLVSSVICFTYDKETHELTIDNLDELGLDDNSLVLDAVYNKCYDAVDMEYERMDIEFAEQQEERQRQEELDEEEQDPYGARSLF